MEVEESPSLETVLAENQLLRDQLEEARAAVTKSEVELESSIHDLNTQLNELTAQVQTKEDEKRAAEDKEQRERQLRIQVEKELKGLRESDKGLTHEWKGLKTKLESSEKEKRDLLVVVSRVESEKKELEDTIGALREAQTGSTTTIRTLEASVAETTENERSLRFKFQHVQAELELVKKDKAWFEDTLNNTRNEWTAFRNEKHLEVVRLQSELDNAQQNASSAQNALSSIKTSHTSLETQLISAHARISTLTTSLAESEASFKVEMTAQQQLVALLEKRDEEGRKRLEDVEREWEQRMGEFDEQERELTDAVARELERGDALEAKLDETRRVVESLAANGAPGHEGDMSALGIARTPGTPLRFGSPAGLTLSPAATLASQLQKTGRGYTEIYSDYIRLQDELTAERAETRRLNECLTEILAEVDQRAPLLREQRAEYERATAEADELASQLAAALEERDAVVRRAEGFRLDAQSSKQEVGILGQQLRDLGRQVRSLIVEIAARDDPGIEPAPLPQTQDEEDRLYESVETDSERVISANLVNFRNVAELQVQNQKLLRITRELGSRLERDESEKRAELDETEKDVIEEAHELINKLNSDLKSSRVRTEALERERDMYRRMCAQRGQRDFTGMEAAGLGNGNAEARLGRGADDVAALAELRANFEAYKTETGVDTSQMKEDLATARREASSAQVSLAKTQAQLDFAHERFKILSQNHELQTKEVSEMNKRVGLLQQEAARQEVAAHRATEEVIAVRASLDRLQHDNASLRAEREIWKKVEERLTTDNANLARERSQFADLLRDLQTVQNSQERTNAETRIRLENQVTKLETQLHDVQKQLARETTAVREDGFRREAETREFQNRVDKLNQDLSATRESLLRAEKDRELATQRADDLSKQLAAKEEKLGVYENRSSGQPTAPAGGVSEVEQLRTDLAETRAELSLARTEVDQARTHVEQFKSISQANEEALTSISLAYDQFKKEAEASVAEKDATVNSLQERLQTLSVEITTTSSELTELHRRLEVQDNAFSRERQVLQNTVEDLKKVEDRAQQAQLSLQDDVRKQSQVAKDAQEKYERELVAHAEGVRALAETKRALDEMRDRNRTIETEIETSRANQASAEASWKAQRATLQKELDDVQKRCQDLLDQNALLHKELQNVTAQATQIRETAVSAEVTAESSGADAAINPLQAVVAYLRRENEITQLQVTLCKQETTRLRQELDRSNQSLDEAQRQLAEEQQRNTQSATSSSQHADLLDKINTLNILRESNRTLRDENERNQRRATELESQLRRANEQLDPLKSRIRELEAELEILRSELKLERDQVKRLQERSDRLMAQYERVDPVELQALKDEVQALRAQQIESQAQKDELDVAKAAVKKAEEDAQETKSKFSRLQLQARELRTRLEKEKDEVRAKASEERAALQTEIDRLKAAESAQGAQEKELDDARKLAEDATAKAVEEARNEALKGRETEVRQQLEKAQSSHLEALSTRDEAHAAAVAELRQKFETQNEQAIRELSDRRIAELGGPEASAAVPDVDALRKQIQSEVEARLRNEHSTELQKAVTDIEKKAAQDRQALENELKQRAEQQEQNLRRAHEEQVQTALAQANVAREAAIQEASAKQATEIEAKVKARLEEEAAKKEVKHQELELRMNIMQRQNKEMRDRLARMEGKTAAGPSAPAATPKPAQIAAAAGLPPVKATPPSASTSKSAVSPAIPALPPVPGTGTSVKGPTSQPTSQPAAQQVGDPTPPAGLPQKPAVGGLSIQGAAAQAQPASGQPTQPTTPATSGASGTPTSIRGAAAGGRGRGRGDAPVPGSIRGGAQARGAAARGATIRGRARGRGGILAAAVDASRQATQSTSAPGQGATPTAKRPRDAAADASTPASGASSEPAVKKARPDES